jgi:septum site-determining protein MinC
MGISARGHVIFNGEIIDKEMIKSGVLQKISMKEGRALVKEII